MMSKNRRKKEEKIREKKRFFRRFVSIRRFLGVMSH